MPEDSEEEQEDENIQDQLEGLEKDKKNGGVKVKEENKEQNKDGGNKKGFGVNQIKRQ